MSDFEEVVITKDDLKARFSNKIISLVGDSLPTSHYRVKMGDKKIDLANKISNNLGSFFPRKVYLLPKKGISGICSDFLVENFPVTLVIPYPSYVESLPLIEGSIVSRAYDSKHIIILSERNPKNIQEQTRFIKRAEKFCKDSSDFSYVLFSKNLDHKFFEDLMDSGVVNDEFIGFKYDL